VFGYCGGAHSPGGWRLPPRNLNPARSRPNSSESGHSQKEIVAKIQAAFQQLFHGDKDTQTVYYSAGQNANGPLTYICDINNNDVRSEGMSYGMMIAVQLNQRTASFPGR
jgi:hypothetical protein